MTLLQFYFATQIVIFRWKTILFSYLILMWYVVMLKLIVHIHGNTQKLIKRKCIFHIDQRPCHPLSSTACVGMDSNKYGNDCIGLLLIYSRFYFPTWKSCNCPHGHLVDFRAIHHICSHVRAPNRHRIEIKWLKLFGRPSSSFFFLLLLLNCSWLAWAHECFSEYIPLIHVLFITVEIESQHIASQWLNWVALAVCRTDIVHRWPLVICSQN